MSDRGPPLVAVSSDLPPAYRGAFFLAMCTFVPSQASNVRRAFRIVIAVAAAMAVCGVLGIAPSAVQASSASTPTWTQQALAVHPTARVAQAMAYDAATGTAVLFGGFGSQLVGDTWAWDGTTWTKQAPATSPPARAEGAMAYDAATGTAVLFGGYDLSHGLAHDLADTWTWG
jgi:hypothetical protein